MPNQNPLVLVDGSSYLYRAYSVNQSSRIYMQNSKGEPTGAIFGVVNMLKSLMKQLPSENIAVVFDAKGKNFRHEMYADYKATRNAMPDDLRVQVESVHNVVRALGLPLISVEGVEADDVLGTLARQAAQAGRDVLICTGDKDMAQLVNEQIKLFDTKSEKEYQLMDRAGVIAKFGVPPELIIDLLALKGDTSDNIPGVAGVGEKTAVALLNGIGSIQQIFANLDKIASLDFRGAKNFAPKIAEQRAQAELSYQLATIKTDVELPITFEQLKRGAQDTETLKTLFTRYELKKWLAELNGETVIQAKPSTSDYQKPTMQAVENRQSFAKVEIDRRRYEIVDNEEKLATWLEKLSQASLLAVDTETDSLDAMQANLVGISFSLETGEACYIPLQHIEAVAVTPAQSDLFEDENEPTTAFQLAKDQLNLTACITKLKPILENPAIWKVGQNIKYDLTIFANHGITLQGVAFDSMLESYVFDSNGKHNMDAIALRYLQHETIPFEAIAGKGKNQLTFDQIAITQAAEYAAEDADVTMKLHQVLSQALVKEPTLAKLFHEIEMPLVSVLARMEQNGVLIEPHSLLAQSIEIAARLETLEKEVHQAAGEVFNLASTKQLQQILFEKLALPVLKKTPKGAPSTNEEVLEELAQRGHLVPKLIMEHRGLSKLKSTYTDKLPQMVNPKTGRVHTSYNQAITATGRLSSSDPNLQNIPVRNDAGRRIRQAFIAREGYVIMAADYSQIELRIMAHLANDQGMIAAFREGRDIHRATAAEIFGTPLEEVSSEQRRSAKAINFGLIYGMSAFGLSNQLGISRADAQNYMNLYFERYPAILQFMQDIRERAAQLGYVETLFGRRLYLPNISASNANLRKAAERLAINAPMQGTAADIIKVAMIGIDRAIQHADDIKMIMQVHDELVFEVKQERVEYYRALIKAEMESAIKLSVPLIADVGVGNNWDEAH